MSDTQMQGAMDLKDTLAYYEDGKHRRYSLLFSVNGGAFAIAKILLPGADVQASVLGGLTLQHLAIGMVAYTILLVADIYVFGEKVRAHYLPGAFGAVGKAVLLLLGFLLCMGWVLVAP
jgi:hypothetical protein